MPQKANHDQGDLALVFFAGLLQLADIGHDAAYCHRYNHRGQYHNKPSNFSLLIIGDLNLLDLV